MMTSVFRRLCVGVLALGAWAIPALGDTGWILTTADFKTAPVSLEQFTDKGVKMLAAGSNQPLEAALDDVVEIRRPGSPTVNGKFILQLTTADRVPGEPVELKGKSILWKNPLLGELSIPLSLCEGFVKSNLSTTLLEGASDLDKVQLANGDWATGILTDVNGTELTLEVNGAATPLPLANLQILKLGQSAPTKPIEGRAFKLLLAGGSSLTTTDFIFEGNVAKFTIQGKPCQVNASDLFGAEHLNGPVCWLSSLTPSKIVQKPFFGTQSKPTRWDALLGVKPFTDAPLPLRFGSANFSRGIGVWSYSRIDYPLPKGYFALRTRYALAYDAGEMADVTVRIKVDDKVLHEMANVHPGAVSDPVLVQIPKDGKTLTLEVDYGDNYDTQDRFAWIEPALLREK